MSKKLFTFKAHHKLYRPIFLSTQIFLKETVHSSKKFFVLKVIHFVQGIIPSATIVLKVVLQGDPVGTCNPRYQHLDFHFMGRYHTNAVSEFKDLSNSPLLSVSSYTWLLAS